MSSQHVVPALNAVASSTGFHHWLSGTDYSVMFGAFAGAVFYVASAVELRLLQRAAYFVVSYIMGIYGSGLVGAKLAEFLGYQDHPLDSLGAVLLSALAIKTLTFFSKQDPGYWLKRLKGGNHDAK